MRVKYNTLPKGAKFFLTDYRSAAVTQELTKENDTRAIRTVAWYDMRPSDVVEAR